MTNTIYVIETKDPETGKWLLLPINFPFSKTMALNYKFRQEEMTNRQCRVAKYTREAEMQNNKAPERIWLTPFTPEVFESDWKHYKRFDGEIEYIRADLVEEMVKDAVKEEMRMIGY